MDSPLTVGVPREIKSGEHRVAVTPDGVVELDARGVTTLVEAGAGIDSGFTDDDYRGAGAQVLARAADVWERAGLVCKVKEPQPQELGFLRADLVLFTYLHLAAYPDVAEALLEHRVTAVAYETVETDAGSLPLLVPMSEIAGRLAPQVAARFLERQAGGRGVLLGGAPGVPAGRVVILGAGTVGCAAAWIAQGLQADVTLCNRSVDRLRWVDQVQHGRITTLAATAAAIERAVVDADVVIGAALVPGARAPVLVSKEVVARMRPGSVIVDVAVDQGGCVETSRETSHAEPVFEELGVLHYGVGNMPAAVPLTATAALTNATLPYLVALATRGVPAAFEADPALARGLNTRGGRVANAAVAQALGTTAGRPD